MIRIYCDFTEASYISKRIAAAPKISSTMCSSIVMACWYWEERITTHICCLYSPSHVRYIRNKLSICFLYNVSYNAQYTKLQTYSDCIHWCVHLSWQSVKAKLHDLINILGKHSFSMSFCFQLFFLVVPCALWSCFAHLGTSLWKYYFTFFPAFHR